MDKETRNLRIAKDILLNTFWIGYVFLLLATAGVFFARPVWQDLVVSQWHLATMDQLMLTSLAFLATAKFLLLFCVLVPALAICRTLNRIEKGAL